MRQSSALFAVVFLVSILIGIQVVEVVNANPIPWAFNPQMTISIQSPQNGTKNSLPVLVNFTSRGDNQFSVSDDASEMYVRSFFYSIDGQDMGSQGMRFEGTNTTTIYENGIKSGFHFNGQVCLTNLANGSHTIRVYYGAVNRISFVGTPLERIIYNPAWQATAQFYVEGSKIPVELNPSTVIFIAIVIAVMAIVSVSVLYLKRNRGKQ
jgi:hypothetical protein